MINYKQMEKEFDKWSIKKEFIHNKNTEKIYFKEQEVWYCYFGCNIGFEQDGKGEDFIRPVFIFKKFNKNLFFGIPLTSKIKDNKFYLKITIDNKEQSLILSQMKIIDSRRLKNRKCFISQKDFIKIKKELIKLIS